MAHLKIDFSKGMALHRLYGHFVFMMEAEKAGKAPKFIDHICESIKCDGQSTPDWRRHLPTHI